MFEIREQNRSTELGDVPYNEADAQFSPADELGRPWIADHSLLRVFISGIVKDFRAYWYSLVAKLLVVIDFLIGGNLGFIDKNERMKFMLEFEVMGAERFALADIVKTI